MGEDGAGHGLLRGVGVHRGTDGADTIPDAMEGRLPGPLTRDRIEALHALAARYGVRNLRVFGSHARGEAGKGSDVDLLVSVDYDRGVARRFVRFCHEASQLLGVSVDVVTDASLDPVLHERILREARAL